MVEFVRKKDKVVEADNVELPEQPVYDIKEYVKEAKEEKKVKESKKRGGRFFLELVGVIIACALFSYGIGWYFDYSYLTTLVVFFVVVVIILLMSISGFLYLALLGISEWKSWDKEHHRLEEERIELMKKILKEVKNE